MSKATIYYHFRVVERHFHVITVEKHMQYICSKTEDEGMQQY